MRGGGAPRQAVIHDQRVLLRAVASRSAALRPGACERKPWLSENRPCLISLTSRCLDGVEPHYWGSERRLINLNDRLRGPLASARGRFRPNAGRQDAARRRVHARAPHVLRFRRMGSPRGIRSSLTIPCRPPTDRRSNCYGCLQLREGVHRQNAPNHLNTQRDEPVERNTTSGFLLRFGIQRTISQGLAAALTLC